MSKQQLTEKFAAQFRGYIPAASGWYLRERNSEGNYQSNVSLLDDANEWLPAATGGEQVG